MLYNQYKKAWYHEVTSRLHCLVTYVPISQRRAKVFAETYNANHMQILHHFIRYQN